MWPVKIIMWFICKKNCMGYFAHLPLGSIEIMHLSCVTSNVVFYNGIEVEDCRT